MGSIQDFILLFLCLVYVKTIGGGRAGRGSPRFTNGGELLCRFSSYRKLLNRILSIISNGVPL